MNNKYWANRLNIWINLIFLLTFCVYQIVMLLDPSSPFWINSALYAYYLCFIGLGIGYFLFRMSPRTHSRRDFPLIAVGCFVGINAVFFFLIDSFFFTLAELGPAGGFAVVLLGPWGEESWRFINFLMLFDILSIVRRLTSFWKMGIAFTISNTLFYFGHYRVYDIWTLDTFLHTWVVFFLLSFSLVVIKNYLVALAAHSITNYWVLLFGEGNIPMGYRTLLLCGSFILWVIVAFIAFIIQENRKTNNPIMSPKVPVKQ